MGDILYVVKEYIGLINQLILFYILSKHRLNINVRKFILISVLFIIVEYIAVLVLPVPFKYLASVFIGVGIVTGLVQYKFIYVVSLYILTIFIESFIESIYRLSFNFTNEFSVTVDILLKCSIFVFLLVILVVFISNKTEYKSTTHIYFNTFLCTSFFVCYALLLFVRVYGISELDSVSTMITSISIMLLLIAFFISYLHFKNIKEKKLVETQFEANKKIVEYQQQYFEEIIESYKQLNSFRHDIEGYIITMEQHILNHDQESLSDLVKLTKNRINSYKSIKCSNTNIAAIVSYFKVLFDEKKIHFNFEYDVPFEINIPADEICTVFYNLLKNAQEATEKLNPIRPEIKMNVNSKNNTVIISVSNFINDDIFDIRNLKRMTTSKGNKKEHGHGLKNIMVVVNKYNGTLDYTVEHDKLSIDIILADVKK